MEEPQIHQRPQADMSRSRHHNEPHPNVVRSRRMIGKYFLTKTLGRGSMGKVKLAINTETNEKVAVKIVSRKLQPNQIQPYSTSAADAAAKREKDRAAEISREIRTIREASIMLLLDHPYIARVGEMLLVDNFYYLIMEYVDGGQLLDYIISHGKLKEKQARQFSRQIASALDYCHRNSIVHRDLKVENILISRTGNIKIIDFGLSNVFSPRSHLSTFCGSLYFAAPELLDGRLYTGPEVDVWSFGVVLYVLLCGQVPFDDPTMSGMHLKVKQGHVEYPSHLSSDSKNLLQRMLVTDPKKRASMSEVIVHPWMVKGYDSPVENHLPKRKPLQLPIDMNIVHGMRGFEFGSEEQIKEELEYLTCSEEYQQAAKSVEIMSNHPFNITPSSSSSTSLNGHHHTTHLLKRRSFSCAMNDPQSMPAAYHPLISIYYLVKERMERDQLNSQPLPSITNTTDEHNTIVSLVEDVRQLQNKNSTKSDNRLSPPTGFSYTADGKTEVHNPTEHEEEMLRKAMAADISPRASSDFGVHHSRNVSDASSISPTKQNVFRRLSRRLSRAHDDANPPAPTQQRHEATPHIRLSDDGPAPTVALNGSPVCNDHTSSSITSSNHHHHNRSNVSLSKKLNKFLKRATSITVKDLPSTQMSKSTEDHSRPQRQSTFNSANSDNNRHRNNSNEEGGFLAPPMSPIDQPTNTEKIAAATTSDHLEKFSGHADDSIRPVYLKGLFSVSTTSTKKASAIRNEIIRVLCKKPDIEYRETRDRFECLVIKPKMTHHQPQTGKDFFEYSDDEESSTHKKKCNNDPSSVRFDIYIVKIPWLLGMRGVQFRRISGDPWQYKNTCSRILDSLLL